MKKAILILAVVLLLTAMTSVTAFARCGGGGYGYRQACAYELCPLDDCDEIGLHQHDDLWYCGDAGWQENGQYYSCPNYGAGYGGCGRGWAR